MQYPAVGPQLLYFHFFIYFFFLPTIKLSKRGNDSSDRTEGGNLFLWAHAGPIKACGSRKCQSHFITNEVDYLQD